MAEPSPKRGGQAALAEPMVGAVTFAQYAFVTAGVADGIELKELLEYEDLDPASWPDAEIGFLELLLDDLDRGALLTLRLDALQGEARKLWERRVPPIDEDLAAWLDFQRALALEEKPVERLRALGIGVADLGRLHREWSAKLEKDSALRTEAAKILERPAEPVEVPAVRRPKLPRRERPAGTGTGFYSALKIDEVVPFERDGGGGAADVAQVAAPVPPLIAPLPPPPPPEPVAEVDIDGTGALRLDMLGLAAVPFEAPADGGDAEAATSAEGEDGAAGDVVPQAEGQTPGGPTAPAYGERHVAYADTEPREPVAAAPRSELDETSLGVRLQLEPPLPFVAGEMQVPAPSPAEPHPDIGQTAEIQRALLDLSEPPVPFTTAPEAPPHGSSDSPRPRSAPVVETEPLSPELLALARRAAFPFAAPRGAASVKPVAGGAQSPAPPPAAVAAAPVAPVALEPFAGPGSLTLEQYAAVETEIGLQLTPIATVLAAYRLTPATRARHAEVLGALMARDPALKARWTRAVTAYREWRLGGRR